MDESEQKASENMYASEDRDAPEEIPASDSKANTDRAAESSAVSEMGNKSSTSTGNITTTPVGSQEGSSKTSVERTNSSSPPSAQQSSGQQASGDKGQGKKEGSSKPPVHTPGPAGGSEKNEPTQASKDRNSAGDKTLAMASSGPGAPPADGGVGRGGNDVMAKMMETMTKGSASATPKALGDPKGSVADMMSKGGGMPDMMSMMAKEGMSDMMAMMAEGGSMADMKTMMSKMEGGPLGMANLFNCIIDVSLSRPDSDPSDDDDDSVTDEIPCQYCSRVFNSQMTLKTHILIAHEGEDSSGLNLMKLAADKGKRSIKDHHGTRRKQSKDCDNSAAVEAARTDSQQHVASSINQVTSSQEDLWAAELSKGVKRGRSERRKSEAAETSEAPGMEEGPLQSDQDAFPLESGDVQGSYLSGGPSESRKRSARLRSLRSSSGGATSQATTKKSKSGDEKRAGDSRLAQGASLSGLPAQPSSKVTQSGHEQVNSGNPKSHRTTKDTPKHQEIKTDSKHSSPIRHAPVTRGKRLSRKDKFMASSDTDIRAETPQSEASSSVGYRSREGRQSSSVPTAHVPDPSPSGHGGGAVSASRRSLRSRKSH